MDLRFSAMSVDTSLAQEYLKKNETLLESYNDFNIPARKYLTFKKDDEEPGLGGLQNTLLNMASKLKENAALITQLEYYIRNIPIEDTSAQLNLIIQYIRCHSKFGDRRISTPWASISDNDPLLVFGPLIVGICRGMKMYSVSKATVTICHLIVTLLHEAGGVVLRYVKNIDKPDSPSIIFPVKGLDSGTVAVVSDDADVDSAVDKIIAVSTQAPWHMRRILVQESVYQQFKDALNWKCNLNKSGIKSVTSDILCSDTLTYNDRTFLIDPVELTEENRSVVTVEAYRTTKEMISLVQQYGARYLSLWTNGIAEINEVTHSTESPVVWVNNVGDFRGPPQVAEAVFSDWIGRNFVGKDYSLITKCDKVAKLCELSQSWRKLDLESRRDILYGVLDKYILLYPENKVYTDIRNSLSTCILNSFVDVGKGYVCIGMPQPLGIVDMQKLDTFFSVESFELLLKGNALIDLTDGKSPRFLPSDLAVLDQAGVPVAHVGKNEKRHDVPVWFPNYPTQTRVVWTNSGTIFAN